jgi:hypothetical protein
MDVLFAVGDPELVVKFVVWWARGEEIPFVELVSPTTYISSTGLI